MWKLLIVFCGSGVGGIFRYLLGGWIAARFGTVFPAGTIAINLLGSLLISAIMQVGLGTTWIHPDLRLALTTGVIGGFTTYSTFNYESLSLFERGAVLLGALNIAATVLGCLIAGGVGLWLGRLVAPTAT